MGAFATLFGSRITHGTIAIPLYGVWAGDVSIAIDDPIGTDGDFVIGNLTMRCHVFRAAAFGGERKCRIVGGAGGWLKIIKKKQYSLAGGVKLSMVLGDAATECGETINVPNDYTIGTGHVRVEAPASRSLRLLAGENWYVDNAGVTQIAAWPTRKVQSPFTVEMQDGAEGRVTIATEDYASWMPGCTFAAPTLETAFASGGTFLRFDGDGIARVEVMTQ